MNARGQFWLMAIVLAYLAIISIFFYVRTADRSSVNLFEPTFDLDFQNIVNAIKTQNNWLKGSANDWYDLNWQYRRRIDVTTIGQPVEIPTGIETGKVSNCINELRVTYMNKSEIHTNISATSAPGCNITVGVINVPITVYVYYGNPSASAPSYRQATPQQGTEISAVISSELEVPTKGLCAHINTFYPRSFLQMNCSLANTVCTGANTQANVSLYIKSTGFEYNGTITPACPSPPA